MSNCEGHTNHVTSSAAQTTAAKENMTTSLPDERLAFLTIRPAPGHPLASLLVYEQERARHPEPSAVEAETVATWANLEELAHEWGSFACALAFITSPASAHIFQAIGMAFLALSHEESAYATTSCWAIAYATRPPPSPKGWNRQAWICMKPLSTGRQSECG